MRELFNLFFILGIIVVLFMFLGRTAEQMKQRCEDLGLNSVKTEKFIVCLPKSAIDEHKGN